MYKDKYPLHYAILHQNISEIINILKYRKNVDPCRADSTGRHPLDTILLKKKISKPKKKFIIRILCKYIASYRSDRILLSYCHLCDAESLEMILLTLKKKICRITFGSILIMIKFKEHDKLRLVMNYYEYKPRFVADIIEYLPVDDIDTFKLVIDKYLERFSVNYLFAFNDTLLLQVIGKRSYEMTKYLLERGACPNVITTLHLTPLRLAVFNNQKNIVELLLKYNAKYDLSLTNLEISFKMNITMLIVRLIKHGKIEDLVYGIHFAKMYSAKGYEDVIRKNVEASLRMIKLPTELLNVVVSYLHNTMFSISLFLEE